MYRSILKSVQVNQATFVAVVRRFVVYVLPIVQLLNTLDIGSYRTDLGHFHNFIPIDGDRIFEVVEIPTPEEGIVDTEVEWRKTGIGIGDLPE
jgi:hypothetical protein